MEKILQPEIYEANKHSEELCMLTNAAASFKMK